MGEAITAYSYEGYSLIDNPGGLARQKKQWICLTHLYSASVAILHERILSIVESYLWVGSIGVQNVSVDGIEEASVTERRALPLVIPAMIPILA